ncbi:RNA-directed DNA polymerase [Phormidium pseudopriestleyi FRX01]|uniref:RNA-directed DNA polymerase n=1 Tax=Phormidium pseudopriestleyi FRX01 TaxID=1759528 RepID=A0ABS3FUE4_9CYAN|nr:RNA-directed DNA polymerase [Phormidium pseudopriestleyi]MBO0350740.1 RNA-directed DNA polymerase [Phormidium pseudopriestleyi FRX01]
MSRNPQEHFQRTKELAEALTKSDIYDWLLTKGYFPEAYVLPPCFEVTKHPQLGKVYFKPKGKNKKIEPKIYEFQQVHFPKTDLTDRIFGIIAPTIHSDIAFKIADEWDTITSCLFHQDNKVCSYSFPIPLDDKNIGKIGKLRSGRMIYEWIEMAENDSASIAFKYKYLIKTDVKIFYPSIYTHSIPWALHGKETIRKKENRNNHSFLGNCLDKLFQSANDGCTNGIPIGPVVSDIVSEIILSGIDRKLSTSLITEGIINDVAIVRFKDDYRILAKTESSGRSTLKFLQSALKEYRLELHDGKTEFHSLPNGLFRNWRSEYYNINPETKKNYDYEGFKEVCLSVIKIDKNNPGCGVIDRFLADLVNRKNYSICVKLDKKSLPKVISLLLMLANLRIKSFPKILGIIEAILQSNFGKIYTDSIVEHLEEFLAELKTREIENSYLISWIVYFIKSNKLEDKLKDKTHSFENPIVKAIHEDTLTFFDDCSDFKIFSDVATVSKNITLLKHLDVFNPQ